jgi:hypothetical protein
VGTNTCTIAGLTPGVAYTVIVTAVAAAPIDNATSAPSAPAVPGPPAAPTGVTAVPGVVAGTAMVSWTMPAGGSAGITYYTASAVLDATKLCNTSDATSTHCTVTGLAAATTYTFKVIAHGTGLAGDSPASVASVAGVLPITRVVNLKAVNNLFVTAENAGNLPLIARSTTAGAWEAFNEISLGGNVYAFQAVVNGMYVSAANGGTSALIANRAAVGAWEKFTYGGSDSARTLLSSSNNNYVSAANAGAWALIANRGAAAAWETFIETVAT